MRAAVALLMHTLYPLDKEPRPSLEQPALEPWRCEVCWHPEEDCECEQDDAETRYCDSLDMGQLSE